MSQKIIEKLNRIESLLQEILLQKEVFNLLEAAKFLDCSPSYLYKLTASGEVPHYKPQGKKLYFKRTELIDFVFQNRIKPNYEIEKESIRY